MEFLHALVLGTVQGITEFLPVSSDGHLLVLRQLLGWPDEGLAFDAALHLGTAAALLIAFRGTWTRLTRALLFAGGGESQRLLGAVVVATIPAAVVGLFAESFVADGLRSLRVAAVGFLLSAVFLVLADRARGTTSAAHREGTPTPLRAFLIGCAQVFALLPGLSRSGSTIGAGVLAGLPRERAVAFSFLIAFPITAGAGLLGIVQALSGDGGSGAALAVGFVSALVSGWLAIRFLLQYVRRHAFTPFIVYLFVAAGVAFFLR